jgi:Right handed beta helix region
MLMKKHKSYLTLLAAMAIFFALGVSNAFSSTYYVDFAGGNDSNTGTSTASPWVHCPGDPNAAGKPATTTLAPGDKVFFKGGVQYNGQVNVNWAGASGNTITYDGNSAGNWGTGKAIIDAQATRSYCFYFGSARNYITINNFELRNGPTSGSPKLICALNSSSYVEVENCTIHNTGYVGPSNPIGVGIWVNGSYWKIHNNLMYDCYDTAINLINGASYNQVYNNEFHDKIRWGVLIKSDSGSTIQTDNSVYNNYFHDIYYYDGLGPHVDWVFLDLTTGGQINNTKVYNNIFTNSKTFTDYGATAIVFIDNAGGNGTGGSINNTQVYNNIVQNPHPYYSIYAQTYGGNIMNTYIYNNSFYTSRGCALFYADTYGNPYQISGINITNNVWGKSNNIIMWLNGNVSNISINYNNYYTSYGSPFKLQSTYYNLTNWRALGYDVNSKGTQSDPLYVNATDSTSDLALKAGSPAIGAGTNLSSIFKTDKDNSPRPQSGTWCMGAYELNPASIINIK